MEEKRYMPITSWSKDDRPREKLLEKGVASLSNAEILAILINTGYREMSAVHLAQSILYSVDNDLGKLARLSVGELQKFKGIGQAKAVSIAAALELGRRKGLFKPDKRTTIRSSRNAFDELYPVLADLNHEEFWVLFLDNSNKVNSKKRIGMGGFSSSEADVRLIFKMALEHTSTSVILAHNHPSGNLAASDSDIRLTKRIVQAGELMKIKVLDHLIIGRNAYLSFADEGLI